MAKESILIKLKEQERKRRQHIILNSTKSLFEKKTFDEINMREIADLIGISPASIYRFFSSRDELLCGILMKELGNIKKQVAQKVSGENFTVEDLALYIVDYLLDNEATFRILCYFYTESKINPKASKRFFNSMLASESIIETCMKKFGISGDPFISAYSFFASLTGVVMCFYNYPDITLKEKRLLMLLKAAWCINNLFSFRVMSG